MTRKRKPGAPIGLIAVLGGIGALVYFLARRKESAEVTEPSYGSYIRAELRGDLPYIAPVGSVATPDGGAIRDIIGPGPRDGGGGEEIIPGPRTPPGGGATRDILGPSYREPRPGGTGRETIGPSPRRSPREIIGPSR